jgi:hypothetical protein
MVFPNVVLIGWAVFPARILKKLKILGAAVVHQMYSFLGPNFEGGGSCLGWGAGGGEVGPSKMLGVFWKFCLLDHFLALVILFVFLCGAACHLNFLILNYLWLLFLRFLSLLVCVCRFWWYFLLT